MSLLQSFKMAFSAIFSNKMRSFLTMLGVIIGVFAVVVLVSVVQGATSEITGQLESIGSKSLTVTAMGVRQNQQLSIADMADFEEIPGIVAFAPVLTASNATARANGETHTTSLYGSTEQYLAAREFVLGDGRNINQTDRENRFQVCVIGVDVADELFGYRDVIGESLRVNGTTYKIVGMVEENAESLMGSNNDFIVIPFETASRIMQNSTIRQIYIQVDESGNVPMVKAQAEQLMERKVGTDNYNVFSAQEILDMLDSSMATMTMMLGGIAGISLLVGGIGIMNIMLVSVTERTREIGIRKAIGAKRRDILGQFLIEAIVITLVGGILALGLSFVTLILLASLMAIPMGMSMGVVGLSLGFCLFIGLVFGVYPANKAANLNPIEALRRE